MARVKVSKVPVEKRLNAVVDVLRAKHLADNPKTDHKDGYIYACGYLQSTLERALDLLPPGKRELFLASLEKQVRPKTRKVRNIMNNEEIEIAYDTPLCCDPSSETYWSM